MPRRPADFHRHCASFDPDVVDRPLCPRTSRHSRGSCYRIARRLIPLGEFSVPIPETSDPLGGKAQRVLGRRFPPGGKPMHVPATLFPRGNYPFQSPTLLFPLGKHGGRPVANLRRPKTLVSPRGES